MSSEVRIKFWGVRGSVPSPGATTALTGGNTSCVEVRNGTGVVILDAGTGIRKLGAELRNEFRSAPLDAAILLTHLHWDHIQGLPFFAPAYDPSNQVRIIGSPAPGRSLKEDVGLLMRPPYFPIPIEGMRSKLSFEEIRAEPFEAAGMRIETAVMNHPGVCVGYRLATPRGALVYMPDNELGSQAKPMSDTAFTSREPLKIFREFAREAEVLIADAHYTAEEYEEHAGWGHSCVNHLVQLGMAAEVKHLFLFHHHPDRDDDAVEHMAEQARQQARANGSGMIIAAAREGTEFRLSG